MLVIQLECFITTQQLGILVFNRCVCGYYTSNLLAVAKTIICVEQIVSQCSLNLIHKVVVIEPAVDQDFNELCHELELD